MRLGFTGTPISLSGADTVEVFGDLIHTYDIQQSQEDHATVPIYYEPRQMRLHLTSKDIDAAVQSTWHDAHRTGARSSAARPLGRAGGGSALRNASHDLAAGSAGAFPRTHGHAQGQSHDRVHGARELRRAVRSAFSPARLPRDQDRDDRQPGPRPARMEQKGYLTTKAQREAIKKRMIDPDDPLEMVIVCDMWLTGTDIPCLHTLYVDKPMQGTT